MALACVVASTASAQLGDYLGPGILTGGAGTIGTRAGEQVALRVFAGVQGIYDTGLEPLSVDTSGNLVKTGGIYGVETDFGAYGVHSWKQAQLGIDYRGAYRHYTQDSFYDGTDHQLLMGVTYQKSKRLYFNAQEIGGTFSRTLGSVPGVTLPIPSVVDQPSSFFFDTRSYFTESSFTTTYLTSARTSFSAGGEFYLLRFHNAGLIGMKGYNLHGSVQHRLSRVTTVGVTYSHEHFDFAGVYGQSDIDSVEGFLSTQFGKRWTFSLRAGGYQTQVQGVTQVALDPNVAAVLGISSFPVTFYKVSRLPTGSASLSRQFKNSSLLLQYTRIVSPGNGIYLTSRSDSGSATYSYTGLRKASLYISGGEYSLSSIGQGLPAYRVYTAGAGASYALMRSLHLTAEYDIRHQGIQVAQFRRTSDRASIGLNFSPGSVPLSLW